MSESLGVRTTRNAQYSAPPFTLTSGVLLWPCQIVLVSISQVIDEVLYTGLIEMQEMDEI